MRNKFTNFVILLMTVVLMVGSVPVQCSALSKKVTKAPYTDVTVKKVGADTYEAVQYLKQHGAFKGVITGKKFYPNKVITRQEFIIILGNIYGDDKIPVTAKDIRYKNTSTNVEGHRLIQLTSNLGQPMAWPVSRTTPRFTRALAAKMIYNFTQLDPAFAPHH